MKIVDTVNSFTVFMDHLKAPIWKCEFGDVIVIAIFGKWCKRITVIDSQEVAYIVTESDDFEPHNGH